MIGVKIHQHGGCDPFSMTTEQALRDLVSRVRDWDQLVYEYEDQVTEITLEARPKEGGGSIHFTYFGDKNDMSLLVLFLQAYDSLVSNTKDRTHVALMIAYGISGADSAKALDVERTPILLRALYLMKQNGVPFDVALKEALS